MTPTTSRRLLAVTIGIAFLALAPVPTSAQQAQVKLPLKDYLALVERAEALERARAEQQSAREPAVSTLATQRTEIVLDEDSARVHTVLEAEVRGEAGEPLVLPIAGQLERATVTPPNAVAIGRPNGRLALVAATPGRYTITVDSVAPLALSGGRARLTLPASPVPVALTRVELGAEAAWSCPGAVVAADSVSGGRRTLELGLARGREHVLETRREQRGAEEERTLARTVVVTVVQLAPSGVVRHDVVLYEVARGSLAVLDVELPPGLAVDRLATDEGEQPPLLDGTRLVVQRTNRLSGIGHLVLTSTTPALENVPLAAVVPDVEVRARYLAFGSSVAAEVSPQPAAAWARVDLGDLPEALREAEAALQLQAAWQLTGTPAAARLDLDVLPAARMVASLVRSRETTTLLTTEGTLLHRDRLVLARSGAALETRLPAGATLWSASVDGMPVRPLERNGAVLVPLALGAATGTVVEIVAVQERAIAEGRSRVVLTLPTLTDPVLDHRWRVLLPDRNRYRFASATLSPVEEPRMPGIRSAALGYAEGDVDGDLEIGGVIGGVAGGVPGPAPPLPPGSAALRAKVVDSSGLPLPGVTATVATRRGEARGAVSDVSGEFLVAGLAPGDYTVSLALPGFVTVQTSVSIGAGTTSYRFMMPASSFEESITVDAESPMIDPTRSSSGRSFRVNELEQTAQRRPHASPEAPSKAAPRDELANLRQGLVGGVKPVPVTIPETGKLLSLAGTLPPAEVRLELEVKGKR